MSDQIILKVKSGAVIDVYATRPILTTVVDVDMMEPGDTQETRLKKTVFEVPLDGIVHPEEVDDLVKDIALSDLEVARE